MQWFDRNQLLGGRASPKKYSLSFPERQGSDGAGTPAALS